MALSSSDRRFDASDNAVSINRLRDDLESDRVDSASWAMDSRLAMM